VIKVSRRVGQITFDPSERTCWMNSNGLAILDIPRRCLSSEAVS